jgi:multidrug efflux pump subunit AcrA (membrane-fusion protein)
VYVLGALCAGAIAAAVLVVGPASQSAATTSRIVTAQRGVVQSTVSGAGNIQAATQLNLGFKTTGVVQHIYVHAGERVTKGQLLAELDPRSTEVTLQQGKASLQAAEATLAQLEEGEGESSSATSGTASASAKAAAAPPTPTKTAQTPTSTTNTTTRTSTQTTAAPTTATTPATTERTKQSAATREANLASARASLKSDKLAVESDEQAVSATKLYAPTSGTIVSLSGEVGESVAGGGTTRASGSEASTSSATGATATSGRSSTSSAASSPSASSSSTSASSSAFAVLSDLSTMQLVVALSESEVIHVHVGQPATVTVEALEGIKLAARVLAVAELSTSNSGVVSYDVTFELSQLTSGLKPGMSATAEVLVKQAEGVNVPTSAISAGTVTVVRKGARVRQRVVTGLAGNNSTIILSGLKAGEQIALPVTSSSSATSLSSRLAGRTGGGLGAGALGGGGGFPGGGPPRGGG